MVEHRFQKPITNEKVLRVGTAGERLIAVIIDILLLFLLLLVFGWIVDLILPKSISYQEFRSVMKSIRSFLVPIYNVLMLYFYQTTVGKRIMGLKVVNENYGNIDLKTVIFREIIGKTVSAFVLGMGFVWILFDKNKQGWHDKIAKTLVVKNL